MFLSTDKSSLVERSAGTKGNTLAETLLRAGPFTLPPPLIFLRHPQNATQSWDSKRILKRGGSDRSRKTYAPWDTKGCL